MTHLGFPDLDEAHLWLHEGIATYVEDIARAEAGETTAAAVWAHFVDEMPQGLPERGDKGLNDTPSHDRRYWGGAMFCLVADVEIRRRTHNRFGLKHALRAVLGGGRHAQGHLGDRARARDCRPRGRRAGAERAVPDVEGEVGGARPRSALGPISACTAQAAASGWSIPPHSPPSAAPSPSRPAHPFLLAGPVLVRETVRNR
jgi:hypothetical protein